MVLPIDDAECAGCNPSNVSLTVITNFNANCVKKCRDVINVLTRRHRFDEAHFDVLIRLGKVKVDEIRVVCIRGTDQKVDACFTVCQGRRSELLVCNRQDVITRLDSMVEGGFAFGNAGIIQQVAGKVFLGKFFLFLGLWMQTLAVFDFKFGFHAKFPP